MHPGCHLWGLTNGSVSLTSFLAWLRLKKKEAAEGHYHDLAVQDLPRVQLRHSKAAFVLPELQD